MGSRRARIGRRGGRATGAAPGGGRLAVVVAAALALLLSGGLAGCAARLPHDQAFVEVRTEHFHVTSSLGTDETIALARSLEFFDAAVRSLLLLPASASATAPTSVYFFDDRTVGRPFAVQNEAAYLIDAVETPILVFRGGRDFAARATPALRASHARRVLRDEVSAELPLWFEEGIAWLAGSAEETPEGVHVGRMIAAFRRSVLDWKADSIPSTLIRDDLSDASAPERERFAARAWAIVHTLEFDPRSATPDGTLLSAYQRALRSPDPVTRDRAFSAIGLSPEALAKRVHAHLELARARVRLLRARGFEVERVRPEALSEAEGRARLGRLALRLSRWSLAREYFERALESDADHLSARLGLAEAEARLGALEASAQILADASLPSDLTAERACEAADAHRAFAAGSDAATLRIASAATARQLYEHALADPALAARAAFGLAQLVLETSDGDVAEADRWIDTARSKRSGSLALDLALAEVEARAGAARSARLRARNAITRSPDALVRDEARALLESLD